MRSIFTVEVLIAIVALSGGVVSGLATYRSVRGERKARSAKLKKAKEQQPKLTPELHVGSNGDDLRRHLREAIGDFTIRDYASDSDVSKQVDSVLDKLEASAPKRTMEGQQQKPTGPITSQQASSRLVHESIEVEAPVDEVFRYWSNFENFSNFMQNVEEVRMTGQDTSHWRVRGPLGKTVEFDARITEKDPNREIDWTTDSEEVITGGEAQFEEIAPGRTHLEVKINYAKPPGGAVGKAVANLLSNPEKNLQEDLQSFARIVERGELSGSGTSTSGR